MYSNTHAKVITPDGKTEWFEILAGVLHGDTLAPFLFTIVLDYAMRKALEGKEEVLGFIIEKRVETETLKIGLHLNEKRQRQWFTTRIL